MKPLQVLPTRDQERFAVDPPEATQAEPPQAMPLLRRGEERFHPDLSLAHRFLVGFGCQGFGFLG
jgi:hypothetical protein